MKILFAKHSGLYRRLILVVALNVPLIFLLLLRNLWRVDFTGLTWSYLFFVTWGYYALVLLVVVSVIFLVSFLSRRMAVGATISLMILFIFYLLIDGQTYSITSIHINSFWLEWIINDYKGLGLPASTIPYALVALLFITAIEIGIFKLSSKITKPKFIVLSIWSLAIVSLIVSQSMHIVTYEKNDMRITGLTPHLPIYTPFTSHSNAARFGDIMAIGDDDIPSVTETFDGALYYPQREIKCELPLDKTLPNIVVIFLESWRFDMLNERVTPNIYKLSTSSTTSVNHFCSGNSTVAGTFGFFYGLNPTYWMAVKSNNVVIDNPVLIDVLKNYGYNFGIFAKSNFKRHKLKDTIFRGIDIYEDFAGRSIVEQDRDLTEQFKKFLQKQKQSQKPFFAFAFFKSNHAPYLYPKEDSVFMPAGDQNLMLANDNTDPTLYLNDYRNSTHYVDRLTGEILDELDSLKLMSNTIVIITTDHGESFNDNQSNFWGHGSNFTKYQTVVPMVFYAPGRAPIMIEKPSAHIDIAPTLLEEFLYCSNDISDYSNGINIFRNQTGSRPFVIGSYVNYAFVFDDNVFEIYPVITRKYKLQNIKVPSRPPSAEMLKTVIDEIGRFYQEPAIP